MGIIDSILGNLVQNVVYWAVSATGVYGADSYTAGVDLNGRWEEVEEKVVNKMGEEMVTKVRCYVDTDVIEGGYLWLGSTSDSGYDANPKNVDDAQRIIAFKKIPRLKSADQFLRQANCNMKGNTTV